MSWPIVELQTVCSLITDGTHYTPPDIGEGVPFLTVRDVSEFGLDFINCSKIDRSEFIKAKQGNSAPMIGDVLFSKDGTVGKVHVVKESTDFAVLSSLAILRPNSSLDSDYFGYVLRSKSAIEQASKNKTGSALRRIILSDLKKIRIPLPPLAEQKRIAAILDKADVIRRKRQQAIQLADDFLRAVFLEMFGDPVTNPKGWEVKPLEDLIDKNDRINYGVVQPGEDNPQGVPLVRSGDLGETGTEISIVRRVSQSIDEKHRKSRLKGNEILIACVGSIGKVGWVSESMVGWNIARAVTRVPLKKSVNREYVFRYLQSPVIQGYFEQETRAVAQPTLNVGLIAKTPIALPPKELQDEFLSIFSRTSITKLKIMNELRKIDELVNSLSQKAFSGLL